MPESPTDLDRSRPLDGDEARVEDMLRRLQLDDEVRDNLRTFLRLLVGGALIGWDELLIHLEQWETEIRGPRADNRKDTQTGSGTVVFVPPGEREARPQESAPGASSDVDELRYLLLGLLFEAESRLKERRSAAFKIAGQTTTALLSPVVRWMQRNERLRPARSRFQKLVQRGERVTGRLIERGRYEELRSRRLVLTATRDTFNASMQQLGQAPELQNLVKQQSAGLSKDVLDEMRARTVSGDLIAEGFVRRLLRRTPRSELPGSPAVSGLEQSPEQLQER